MGASLNIVYAENTESCQRFICSMYEEEGAECILNGSSCGSLYTISCALCKYSISSELRWVEVFFLAGVLSCYDRLVSNFCVNCISADRASEGGSC